MSSMYKGLLIVVAATVITSGMILMTGKYSADNKQLESSGHKTVSEKARVNDDASKNVTTLVEAKQPVVSLPPPPCPFIYGAPDNPPSIITEENKSGMASQLDANKPQAPVLSSTLEFNNVNAPVKPTMPVPHVTLKQAPVVVMSSESKMPIVPQKKATTFQHQNNDVVQKLVKPTQVVKTLEVPTIKKSMGSVSPEIPSIGVVTGMNKPALIPPPTSNIKLTESTLELLAVQNIVKPKMPSFQAEKPVKPENKMSMLTFSQSVLNTGEQAAKPLQQKQQGNKLYLLPVMGVQKNLVPSAPVARYMPPSFNVQMPQWQQKVMPPQMSPESPQNLIPSYQMVNPTMPVFYYYYPAPNWNNAMPNNWNIHNQMPYFDYRLDSQINSKINKGENTNLNNMSGPSSQNTQPPTMMQKNTNNPTVNGQTR